MDKEDRQLETMIKNFKDPVELRKQIKLWYLTEVERAVSERLRKKGNN